MYLMRALGPWWPWLLCGACAAVVVGTGATTDTHTTWDNTNHQCGDGGGGEGIVTQQEFYYVNKHLSRLKELHIRHNVKVGNSNTNS